GGAAQIVLASDGNQTRGNYAREAVRLAAQGLPVYCLPVERGGPDLSARIVESPQAVRPGEPFAVIAEVSGTGRVDISAHADEGPAVEGALAVSGSTRWRAELALTKPGMHRIEVSIRSREDSYSQNNTAAAAVWVAGPASLLCVCPPGSTLVKAAQRSGFAVTAVTPAGIPPAAEFAAYDAILIEDSPRAVFPMRAMQDIRSYVHDFGGGLVMAGGGLAFGPGGFTGTPIEQALPVKCDPEEQTSRPLALAVVIDRSGSMADKTAGRSKLSFAQDGLALVLDQLKEQDQLAVIAFAGSAETVRPLGPVRDKDAVLKSVAALAAGGTTDLNPPLEQAIGQLAGAGAEMLRHAIVLSDGLSQQEVDPDAWARRFVEQKITVSTLATGKDAKHDLLQALAVTTGGNYHSVGDIQRLPEIFAAEARPAPGKLLKQSPGGFPVRLLESPLTAGLSQPPRASEYVLVKPKQAAEVAVEVDGGNALLATWRFGVGRSAAFAAPAGALAEWNDAPSLWGSLLAWVARPAGGTDVTASVTVAGGIARIDVADPHAEGTPDYRAVVGGPDGTAIIVPLRQIAPDLYSAQFPAEQPGIYPISILEQSGGAQALKARAAAVVQSSPEWQRLQANTAALAEISSATGGRIIKNLSDLPQPSGPGSDAYGNVSWAAVILAIALFLVELALA
ncbi:MAG TPA: VWA domain-containing protein, partial [Planctomycetota bacterium]|nr:VWA domain-containing protein [Planctomycetota bacterium]